MSDDPDHDDTTADTEEPEAPPLAPLLALREPLTAVVDTPEALAATCEALARGTGPVAIDAERASGYRYSSRAYLVQLRREGAGTHLVDPIAFESLAPLAETLAGTEWILHAATQDLPCLAEIGLRPDALFDTELAGRLLGYPRVGLAALVELKLGLRMAKEHSAVDWSTRPLPQPWLEYAALDVEVLAELQALLVEELEEAGKTGWATEEFDALRDFKPTPRVDAWRRTSGLHKVRGRRSLGAVRALWQVRDEIAQERDVTPGRILPDTAIVAAATALPTHRRALLKTQGFHGRGAERYASRWVFALKEASELPEEELPARAPRGDGPPVPRAWAEKDPVAAQRLTVARAALTDLAEEHHLPVENVLTPDHVRRLLWTPPATRQPTLLAEAVDQRLTEYGARAWQRHLTVPLLTEAILAAEPADDVAAATGPA
jgi:ribonuclease D